jgi:signal peptidase I
MKKRSKLLIFLGIIGGIVMFAAIVGLSSFETKIVTSSSMLPSFQPNDRVVMDKVFYNIVGIKRGDVLIFQDPSDTALKGRQLMHRVVGLPGEKVEIKNGKVLINDEALNEPYELENPAYQYGPFNIHKGSYFVLGDNRNNSFDSHAWGVLKLEDIRGRVIFGY